MVGVAIISVLATSGELMPSFPFTVTLGASSLGTNPLAGWQYEYNPYEKAAVSLMVNTAGASASVQLQVTSGSQTIQQRGPVQAGGTAGVTPSSLNTQPITWIAGKGDRLIVSLDETAAATPVVNGLIEIEPAVL